MKEGCHKLICHCWLTWMFVCSNMNSNNIDWVYCNTTTHTIWIKINQVDNLNMCFFISPYLTGIQMDLRHYHEWKTSSIRIYPRPTQSLIATQLSPKHPKLVPTCFTLAWFNINRIFRRDDHQSYVNLFVVSQKWTKEVHVCFICSSVIFWILFIINTNVSFYSYVVS